MKLQDSNQKASYNDLQVQHTVREQKEKEKMERNKKEQQKRQQKMKESYDDFRYSSLKLLQIDKLLLFTIIFSIIFAIVSLVQGSFTASFSCIISAIFTLLVGKSSFKKNENQKLTNQLLYNLSQSLYDFIDIKIPFEVFSNKQKWLDMYTVFGFIIYIICPSSNILYGIVTIMIIISYLVSFSMKDVENIYTHVKIIVVALFIGIFVKFIVGYFILGLLNFDSMNIILLNIFTILKIYSDRIVIYHT